MAVLVVCAGMDGSGYSTNMIDQNETVVRVGYAQLIVEGMGVGFDPPKLTLIVVNTLFSCSPTWAT